MKASYFILIMFLTTSCFTEWLDIKPDKKMVLPASLKDIQAMLDNTEILNTGMPSLGEVGTDDFFINDDTWQNLGLPENRNTYIWAENIYEDESSVSWNIPYQAIFYTNLALESLDKLPDHESDQGRSLRGSAHFFRAWAYFNLAQIFCLPYDASDGEKQLGLPLRLESDVNIPSRRSSIRETYDVIREDLSRAVDFLPERQTVAVRPSKAAAYAFSAIFYLQTGDYSKALQNAESCLSIYNELQDYNSLNPALAYPFIRLNKEVIYHSTLGGNAVFGNNGFYIIPELYNEFEADDLRRDLFFRTSGLNITFRGSNNGNNTFFNGIATDEIMLIKAECLARLGRSGEALKELSDLLKYRYKAGTYREPELSGDQEVLDHILLERRKQLVFRGRRWWELRRLNKDSRYAKTLKRDVLGKTYELSSNSVRYALPFPDDVIRLSGMEQNLR